MAFHDSTCWDGVRKVVTDGLFKSKHFRKIRFASDGDADHGLHAYQHEAHLFAVGHVLRVVEVEACALDGVLAAVFFDARIPGHSLLLFDERAARLLDVRQAQAFQHAGGHPIAVIRTSSPYAYVSISKFTTGQDSNNCQRY